MYDIFLSYAHGKDDIYVPFTMKVCQYLEDLGLHVWLDIHQIHTSPMKEMKKGIENSKVFVALLTPEYMESYNCNFEYVTALGRMPILLASSRKHQYRSSNFAHIQFPMDIDIPVTIKITKDPKKLAHAIYTAISH